jgi:hypothetical protein
MQDFKLAAQIIAQMSLSLTRAPPTMGDSEINDGIGC